MRKDDVGSRRGEGLDKWAYWFAFSMVSVGWNVVVDYALKTRGLMSPMSSRRENDG